MAEVLYCVPGKLSLFVRPKVRDGLLPHGSELTEALNSLLRQVPGLSPHLPTDLNDREDELLFLPDKEFFVWTLQTLNFRHPAIVDHMLTEEGRRAVTEVYLSVREINEAVGGIGQAGFVQIQGQQDPAMAEIRDHKFREIHDARTEIGLDLGKFDLIAASPDWLTVPLQDPCDCGCPGSKPELFDKPQRPSFGPTVVGTLLNDILKEHLHQTDKIGRVRIAVMDTWPDQAVIDARDAEINEPVVENERLRLLKTHDIVASRHVHTGFQTPDDIYAKRRDDATFDDYYNQSDHGVFTTELIYDIVHSITDSEFELHVYRVLSDTGIGTQAELAKAVSHAVNLPGEDPIVINLSLGIGPSVELLPSLLESFGLTFDRDVWASHANRVLQENSLEPAERLNRLRALRNHPTMAAARYLFQRDHQDSDGTRPDVLFVAAAGNDRVTGGPEPAPRFPAIVEGVIGVSAVTGEANGTPIPSDFSNLNDVLAPDDGLGALGDGVVGLYVSPFIGDTNVSNNTGWATWSGTSFAAPIISGISALLFAKGVRHRKMASGHTMTECLIEKGAGPRSWMKLEQSA